MSTVLSLRSLQILTVTMFASHMARIVIDYCRRPSLREMVTCYVAREHKFTGRFQFASVLLAFNEILGVGALEFQAAVQRCCGSR